MFKVAALSKDPEGVVSACLVKDGKILVSSPSADDGVRHAEDLVIEKALNQQSNIDDSVTLYTTLEPCSYRNPKKMVRDCTTIIIEAGIKNVVFGANDPEYSKDARQRLEQVGVSFRQVSDPDIIRRCVEVFNCGITVPLNSMGLPRAKKLP